jgi:hypothetical protein
MTRIQLFKALCETTTALENVTCVLLAGPTRTALEALCARMDALLDRCIREGVQPLHAADRSPCPACGQACCTHWRVLQGARPVAEEVP